ncbi:MAG: radical SAM protein [Candidatus Gastranaerophilales bacterium]|nr:radical SAM protein [Candidatus Gastranaerophilales bacterium]
MINNSRLFDAARDLFSKYAQRTRHGILPVRFFFELTHRCNLFCPYCYLGKNRVKEEMTTVQWLDVIKQIPFYSFITLVGGEPLIREDFPEILSACAKKTYNKTHVVTNGVLIDEKIVDSFIKSKLLLLSVSLDGWMEHHDIERGHKDKTKSAFKRILKNLDDLSLQCKASHTNIMVDIKTIVLKDNLEDILKLYEFATNKGFEFFSISFLRNNNLKQNPCLSDNFTKEFYAQNYPIEPYFDMEKFEKIYLEMQKMKKYSKTKIRFAPKFDEHNSKLELDKIKRFFTEVNKPVNEIYEPCLYPWANTIINPMGDIYPCLSYKMGNVKDTKIIDIFNSQKYLRFRENLKNSHVFSSCQMCCELKVKGK